MSKPTLVAISNAAGPKTIMAANSLTVGWAKRRTQSFSIWATLNVEWLSSNFWSVTKSRMTQLPLFLLWSKAVGAHHGVGPQILNFADSKATISNALARSV